MTPYHISTLRAEPLAALKPALVQEVTSLSLRPTGAVFTLPPLAGIEVVTSNRSPSVDGVKALIVAVLPEVAVPDLGQVFIVSTLIVGLLLAQELNCKVVALEVLAVLLSRQRPPLAPLVGRVIVKLLVSDPLALIVTVAGVPLLPLARTIDPAIGDTELLPRSV
jgi:hypothetical protein